MAMVNVLMADILVFATLAAAFVAWRDWFRRWPSYGGPWPRVEPPEFIWNPAAVLLAVSLVGLGIWSAALPDQGEPKSPTIAGVQITCLVNGTIVLLLLPLLVSFDFSRLELFGFTDERAGYQIADGLELMLASLVPVFIVLMVTKAVRTPETQHAFLRLLQDDSSFGVVVWLVLAACLFAPLMEELLFRVVLQGWLQTILPAPAAIGISAICFSLIHGLTDGIALLPLAILLGWHYERRRRFLSIFTAHAFFNLWNITLVLSA